MRRLLIRLALVLITWATAAIVLVDHSPCSLPQSKIGNRKRERTREFYGSFYTLAAVCMGIVMLLDLSKWMTKKSHGSDDAHSEDWSSSPWPESEEFADENRGPPGEQQPIETFRAGPPGTFFRAKER
jgi:hypothetical protein